MSGRAIFHIVHVRLLMQMVWDCRRTPPRDAARRPPSRTRDDRRDGGRGRDRRDMDRDRPRRPDDHRISHRISHRTSHRTSHRKRDDPFKGSLSEGMVYKRKEHDDEPSKNIVWKDEDDDEESVIEKRRQRRQQLLLKLEIINFGTGTPSPESPAVSHQSALHTPRSVFCCT
jgi:serine/threonine-protein kinase PRP4